MKKLIVLLLLLIAVPRLLSCNKNEDKPIPEAGVYETIINLETGERQFAYLSNVYEVEGIYNSMNGQSSVKKISLMDSDEPESVDNGLQRYNGRVWRWALNVSGVYVSQQNRF